MVCQSGVGKNILGTRYSLKCVKSCYIYTYNLYTYIIYVLNTIYIFVFYTLYYDDLMYISIYIYTQHADHKKCMGRVVMAIP